MKVADSIIDLIGNTPIVKINKLNHGFANIYAKLESFNPLSSIKDRLALAMIEEAERHGKIDKETHIIEPTSGNTGIGLAYICAIKGYKLTLTMPESMSIERRKLISIFGANIVLTEASKGMNGAVAKAFELAHSYKNSFIPQQFENMANPQIHFDTTGVEIWEDMDGKVDLFVSAVGTGGTLTGAGNYLKSMKEDIKIVAVEPAASPVLSGGSPAPHKIQGIGAGFIPKTLDQSVYDEIIKVENEDAFEIARSLAKNEGIFAGISSGAAMKAALELSLRSENRAKNIVVILPDTGERYLSVF